MWIIPVLIALAMLVAWALDTDTYQYRFYGVVSGVLILGITVWTYSGITWVFADTGSLLKQVILMRQIFSDILSTIISSWCIFFVEYWLSKSRY